MMMRHFFLAVGLIAIAIDPTSAQSIRSKETAPGSFTLTLEEGVSVFELDQWSEGECPTRPSCRVRGYFDGKLVFALDQDGDTESRRIDCRAFDRDVDHQCLRSSEINVAPVALAQREPRAKPSSSRASSRPVRQSRAAPSGNDGGGGAYFSSCREARAAGAAPLRRGQTGYRAGLDRDNDGIACE